MKCLKVIIKSSFLFNFHLHLMTVLFIITKRVCIQSKSKFNKNIYEIEFKNVIKY